MTDETTTTVRPMRLSANMLDVLGLDADNASRGNVAAHAWRLTRATNRDPFAGLNLGFVDKQASTDFLSGIVSDIDGGAYDRDDLHELADGAVPVYNAERLAVLDELDPYGQEEVDPNGFGVDGTTRAEAAGFTLYDIAEEVASAILSALDDLGDDDETSED